MLVELLKHLFFQYLCQTKLQLAIKQGLRQETTLLSHDMFVHELESAVQQEKHTLKDNVLEELDVLSPE